MQAISDDRAFDLNGYSFQPECRDTLKVREEEKKKRAWKGSISMYLKVSVPGKFQLKLIPTVQNLLFLQSNDIHYIGGTDVLPAPLEREDENECIMLLGTEEGGEEARKRLIEHNLRLVVYIAKKFDNTGIGVEDLISIGTIGLIKSINTYNPGKNIKLATYASRCIENEILMYLRRTSKMKMEVSFDEPLNVDWDGNELLLSDILGTEDDIIYKDMEVEVEKKLLKRAIQVPFLLEHINLLYKGINYHTTTYQL